MDSKYSEKIKELKLIGEYVQRLIGLIGYILKAKKCIINMVY
jgi:hypothetical protein